ncbi:MAG: histidine phosphatase family protein [Victivallaceae bacterium]|nr:histidine phosphatase family protein [Victivallaceae bacterium]
MKNIVTIQHTQSVHHTNGMIGSWTDWPLSEFGVEQAETLGRNLAVELASGDYVIYTSDLLRASRTAEIVGRHFNVTPIADAALRERNLGEAVGKTSVWAREKYQAYYDGTRKWSIDDKVFQGAESIREAYRRIEEFVGRLLALPHERIMVVSHGDALSIFNAVWLRMEVGMLNRCRISGHPGGVSFMAEDADGKRLITRLSDLAYLK